MQFVANFFSRMGIARDFFSFLWKQKLWWLIPLFVILILIGLVLVFSHGSVIAPFIYALF